MGEETAAVREVAKRPGGDTHRAAGGGLHSAAWSSPLCKAWKVHLFRGIWTFCQRVFIVWQRRFKCITASMIHLRILFSSCAVLVFVCLFYLILGERLHF